MGTMGGELPATPPSDDGLKSLVWLQRIAYGLVSLALLLATVLYFSYEASNRRAEKLIRLDTDFNLRVVELERMAEIAQSFTTRLAIVAHNWLDEPDSAHPRPMLDVKLVTGPAYYDSQIGKLGTTERFGNVYHLQHPARMSAQRHREYDLSVYLLRSQMESHSAMPGLNLSYFVNVEQDLASNFPYIPAQTLVTSTSSRSMEKVIREIYEPFEDLIPKGAIPKNTLQWSKPYLDTVTRKAIASCFHPIFDRGRYIGLVATDVALSTLANRLRIQSGDAGTYYLLSDHGAAMASSAHFDAESLPPPVPQGWRSGTETEAFAGDKLSLQGDHFIRRYRIQSTGWWLEFYVPVSAIDREQRYSMAAILALLAFVLALGYVAINRRLIKPLYAARQAAETARTEALQARRLAENANRTKSMFLANMSHEIRTPMNAVIGLAHLVMKTDISPKQRDYLLKIHNSAISLLGIINDILDISKIEAGRLEIEIHDFDLNAVLQNLATTLAPRFEGDDVELLFDIPKGLRMKLKGDGLRLGQVLLNLVGNAIKFTKVGEVIIRVQEITSLPQRVEIRFTVADTGIGMSAQQMEHVFEPFTQADPSTTRKFGGTGLGLSISKHLVELMGGRIEAQSTPGQGTSISFSIWFDLVSAVQRPATLPAYLRLGTVLVVDDHINARHILAELARGMDLEVEECSSGQEAIDRVANLSRPRISAVLMDFQMPGMNGAQAANRIKALPGAPAVIMVTAFGQEEVRRQSDASSADAFLLKPVSASTLLDTFVNVFAATQPAIREPVAHLDTSSNGNEDLSGLRVLLAEDNAINAEIAIALLQDVGMIVDHAENGRLAIDRLMVQDPATYALVLMDIQMPEMDGFQACTLIRADARFKDLPVIAMTAHAMLEERNRCLAAGMDDHIAKPIDPGKFIQVVRQWSVKAREAQSPYKAMAEQTLQAQSIALWLTDTRQLRVSEGLLRVAGKQALYLKLLKSFALTHAHTAARLSGLLASGDYTQLRFEAHALRGVAGNIAAVEVEAVAGVLEQLLQSPGAIRESDINASAVVSAGAELVRALDSVITHLHGVLQDGQGPVASKATLATPPTDHSFNIAVSWLVTLLQADDIKAAAEFDRLRSLIAGVAGSAATQMVEQAIGRFDFAAALQKLNEISAATSEPR
jgi:two-component system, sensor histidine kinase and response regulator